MLLGLWYVDAAMVGGCGMVNWQLCDGAQTQIRLVLGGSIQDISYQRSLASTVDVDTITTSHIMEFLKDFTLIKGRHVLANARVDSQSCYKFWICQMNAMCWMVDLSLSETFRSLLGKFLIYFTRANSSISQIVYK